MWNSGTRQSCRFFFFKCYRNLSRHTHIMYENYKTSYVVVIRHERPTFYIHTDTNNLPCFVRRKNEK